MKKTKKKNSNAIFWSSVVGLLPIWIEDWAFKDFGPEIQRWRCDWSSYHQGQPRQSTKTITSWIDSKGKSNAAGSHIDVLCMKSDRTQAGCRLDILICRYLFVNTTRARCQCGWKEGGRVGVVFGDAAATAVNCINRCVCVTVKALRLWIWTEAATRSGQPAR